MLRTVVIAISLLFCISTSMAVPPIDVQSNTTVEDELKWLDTADVDQIFTADIKAGVHKFYVYCGRGCDALGINYMNSLTCFPSASYREMMGGTDAFGVPELDRLEVKAVDFTRTYNFKLAQYLTNHGLSRCDPGEDWWAADEQIVDFLGTATARGEGSVISYDKQTHRFRFALFLLEVHQNNSLYSSLCRIARDNHLSGGIIFEIYSLATKAATGSIACIDGVARDSNWRPKPSDSFDLLGSDSGG